MKRIVVVACMMLGATLSTPADDLAGHTWKQIRMPGQGSVALLAPDSWHVSAKRATEDEAPTIEFSPLSGDAFSVQMTIFGRNTKPKPPRLNLKNARGAVEIMRDMTAQQAHSTWIDIRELKSESDSIMGYYFTVTDSHPEPGEWRLKMGGAVILDKFLVMFTVLTKDGEGSEVSETFAMLEGAKHLTE